MTVKIGKNAHKSGIVYRKVKRITKPIPKTCITHTMACNLRPTSTESITTPCQYTPLNSGFLKDTISTLHSS